MERLGETIEIDIPLSELPIAQRQMVAMRGLLRDCRLLIMDEPTASLSARETVVPVQLIRQLRRDGVTILYVTHRLEEIFQIADRVTVLRDGQLVVTSPVAEVTTDGLIRAMVGREIEPLTHRLPDSSATGGEVILEVAQLSAAGAFRDVSFEVRAGEIVGLAGLVGAGRSEVARELRHRLLRFRSGLCRRDPAATRISAGRDPGRLRWSRKIGNLRGSYSPCR